LGPPPTPLAGLDKTTGQLKSSWFRVTCGEMCDGSKSEVKRQESPEATDKVVAKNEDAAKAEEAV
jgi:hypothetical protein